MKEARSTIELRYSSTFKVMVNSNGVVFSSRGKAYSQFDHLGYRRIKLRGRGVLVHRIVADAFHGPSDLEVNHEKGIKHDNRPSKLSYATHQENVQHAYDIGLNDGVASAASLRLRRLHLEKKIPVRIGVDHHNAKLTPAKVRKIRASKGRISNREAGLLWQVSEWTIKNVRGRKTWKHVT